VPTNSWSDLLELDRRAVLASVAAVAEAGPDDLARPTPCAGWTLADLLAHMTVQQHGFADASTGAVTQLPRWAPVPLGDTAVAAYTTASQRALEAFAQAGVADHKFSLPEIRDGGAFPAELAMGFHLVDNTVHTWDVAATLGVTVDLAPDVVAATLRLVEGIPDGDERLAPGAAFAPGLEVPADATPQDRILLLLGRSPGWTPPVGG
jgi:uncharacterized protein (TIGR03086 family)